jgi:hypothetical protein
LCQFKGRGYKKALEGVPGFVNEASGAVGQAEGNRRKWQSAASFFILSGPELSMIWSSL